MFNKVTIDDIKVDSLLLIGDPLSNRDEALIIKVDSIFSCLDTNDKSRYTSGETLFKASGLKEDGKLYPLLKYSDIKGMVSMTQQENDEN